MKSLILLFCLIFIPFAFNATRHYVKNTNDSGTGSLRDQIAASNTGDTVFIDVAGILTLQTGIVLNKNLVIIGPGPIHFNIDMSLINGVVESAFNFHSGSFNFNFDGIGFFNGSATCIGVNSAFLGTINVKRGWWECWV